jgi:outer membrane immunogenic protein
MKKFLLGAAALIAFGATANAADLPARIYTKAPAVTPVYDWSGLYIGGHVGYGWGHEHDNLSTVLVSAPIDRFPVDGVIGGVHAGYNWQTGHFVFGLEGDFDGSGIKGSATVTHGYYAGTSLSFDNEWQASIRARAGYAANNWLLYVTGGAAFAGVKSTLEIVDDLPSSASRTLTGWTVGVGAEHALSRNWIARGEFRYTDFGSKTAQFVAEGDSAPTRVRFTDARATLGVSYKF